MINLRTFDTAVKALQVRLDPGNKLVAAQDFRHLSQNEGEPVAKFISRLETIFKVAYGKDAMATETHEVLQYGQMQEGLRYEIIKSPAISGAQSYKELCIAAQNEEKRITGLKKRQNYVKGHMQESKRPNPPRYNIYSRTDKRQTNSTQITDTTDRHCYVCGEVGHLAMKCKQAKKESSRPSTTQAVPKAGTQGLKAVKSIKKPLDLLYSDSDSEHSDSSVSTVRVQDKGSRPRKVTVTVQGIPTKGVIDSGADITIINADLLKNIAAAAKLRKKAFKQPDKVPYTYDQKPFQLDGRIDLDISFDGRTMRTPVYVKMDAKDHLLLSEGVCSQLHIITYHPAVNDAQPDTIVHNGSSVTVPCVRVKLLQTVRVPPLQSTTACVQLESPTRE